jgi:hypothetical protein
MYHGYELQNSPDIFSQDGNKKGIGAETLSIKPSDSSFLASGLKNLTFVPHVDFSNKSIVLIFVFLWCNTFLSAQQKDSNTTKEHLKSFCGSDTTNATEFYKRAIAIPHTLNKSRYKAVAIGSGTIWAGTLIFLNNEWYSQYPKSKFHTFNDNGEWQQMDKVGHIYSAYLGSKLFSTFFRWTGLSEKKSVLIGAGGGLAYQTIIEILDGHSQKWGFSWGDMGMNTLGCGIYASQQLLWHEQRIKIKYSWHLQYYKEVELLRRANDLYGRTVAERCLKDYNAQTYWLSCNIRSFAPASKWPKWLNIAVGYGAQNMYGGYTNTWTDDANVFHNRTDIPRYRQYYVAPDIDFSKIPWKSKFLKDFFKIVNLKAPLPSLEYNSLGQWRLNAIHF